MAVATHVVHMSATAVTNVKHTLLVYVTFVRLGVNVLIRVALMVFHAHARLRPVSAVVKNGTRLKQSAVHTVIPLHAQFSPKLLVYIIKAVRLLVVLGVMPALSICIWKLAQHYDVDFYD